MATAKELLAQKLKQNTQKHQLAQKDNITYVSSDYLAFAFKNIILNKQFDSLLWDKPDNYEELSIDKKIDLN